MADIFLRSTTGSDGNNGATWALAKATCAAALTAAGASGHVWVSKNHAETQASDLTLTASVPATPNRVICVNDDGDPEPPTELATGGKITTTGGNNQLIINGAAYYHGVLFTTAEDIEICPDLTTLAWFRANQCQFEITGTGGTDQFRIGKQNAANTCQIEFDNCDFIFADTAQELNMRFGRIVMRGGSIAATGSVPVIPIVLVASVSGVFELIGVDLSAMGSGSTLVNLTTSFMYTVRFVDCKLGSSVALVSGTHQGPGSRIIELVNCDSGDTNTRYERSTYQGDETSETTVVLDASDGTTTFARKMVSSANSKVESPMESLELEFWNDKVGSSQTVTIEVVTDGVTLTDIEAWAEVEYLGTSGFPLGLFASDRLDDFIFGTPVNQTTSSAGWTTTGLSTPVKQKFEVPFTAEEKGLIRVRVMLAKPSTTMYFSPDPVLS